MTEFKPVVFSADCNEDGIMHGKRTNNDNSIPGHRDLL